MELALDDRRLCAGGIGLAAPRTQEDHQSRDARTCRNDVSMGLRRVRWSGDRRPDDVWAALCIATDRVFLSDARWIADQLSDRILDRATVLAGHSPPSAPAGD